MVRKNENPFQVKMVLQLLQQVLEVPQTRRHHEVHASLHLQSDQEHPECRGLPGNNRPAANQSLNFCVLLVVMLYSIFLTLSPLNPGSPFIPATPPSPTWPFGPSSPVIPWGPGGPGGPSKPDGPAKPAIPCDRKGWSQVD